MNNTAKEKKPKTMPWPLKTMRTVFWDAEEFIFEGFLLQGESNNAAHCLQMLKKLYFGLWDKCLGKKNIVMQHDSTQPHNAYLWMERFQKNSWGASAPPILQSRKSRLFRFINDQMQGQHYAISEAIQATYFIFMSSWSGFLLKRNLQTYWEKCID